MTRLLQRYLGSGDALARLQDHAARLRRLQGVLERGLPAQLAGACRVANLKDEILVVAAQGGAVAARLKQMVPSLQAHFLQAGYPLQGIKVKVATPQETVWRRPPPERHISAEARSGISDFAATLPADSPLRKALERLAQRSG
ncbi:hypothetical protein CJ010_05375 [Azoarcus sp. DD4]|uniref:DciA family protein n=1 Tax=Azoarcus sp. DD4 TaxID=2027405 RepID=UPI00112901A3|nr:DciA family protein [Azoarcus sp. DD4]QDF96011.1 hypothetical protein CJ010_05375 [Azoarcus sp. DD4]